MTSFVADDMEVSVTNLSISMADMSIDDGAHDLEHRSPLRTLRSSSPLPELAKRAYSRDVSPSAENPPIGSVSPILEPEKPLELDNDLLEFLEQVNELTESEQEKPKFSVILSSHGYKHVFSRTWVSKKELNSIVERPERLKACCLGIGMARTEVPFKLLKSSARKSLYSPHVQAVHGEDWPLELYALCSKAAANLARRELEVPESWPYYDIYLSPHTVEALEGNVAAIELAIDEIYTGDIHRSFVMMRPPGHHCHEDEASGFCIMNNAHIAIQYAKMKHDVTHAVILDFDLHHGDGSQDLLWKLGFDSEGNAEIPMGYFSIHDINSFPCEAGFAQPKQLGDASVCFVAHNAAIWNVHLKPYETVKDFDALYDLEYSILFRKAAQFLEECHTMAKQKKKPFKPLVVLSAGFDGSEFETPGMQRHNVHVPTSFYNRFTRDSVALAEHFGEGHLISLLEGGYSSAAVATGVFSHLTGMGEKAYDISWCPAATTPNEIDFGMRQRWKYHEEKWSANGIRIGRTIFPPVSISNPSSAPSSFGESVVREKHNLRPRKDAVST